MRCSCAICCLLFFVGGLAATVWMYRSVPTGFIPQEDQGYLIGVVQAPPGASLAYTSARGDKRRRSLLAIKDMVGCVRGHGLQLLRRRRPMAGMIFLATKPIG